MDHDASATESGGYERPRLVSYGSLLEMTAGCIGNHQSSAELSSSPDFAGASPPFGDPVLCEHS